MWHMKLAIILLFCCIMCQEFNHSPVSASIVYQFLCVQTLGPYCATMCLKEVLTPPARRNRADEHRQRSADAHPKFGAYLDSDSEDELEDLKEDTW